MMGDAFWVGIGWATCWPCRDWVRDFGGTARFFVVAAWRSILPFWQSVSPLAPRSGSRAFGTHAVDVPGFACIRSA